MSSCCILTEDERRPVELGKVTWRGVEMSRQGAVLRAGVQLLNPNRCAFYLAEAQVCVGPRSGESASPCLLAAKTANGRVFEPESELTVDVIGKIDLSTALSYLGTPLQVCTSYAASLYRWLPTTKRAQCRPLTLPPGLGRR